MPKTISELEEQRAKILAEIESRAGGIPKADTQSNRTSKGPTLNEWLSAAEDVMPDEKAKTISTSPNTSAASGAQYSQKMLQSSPTRKSTTPFFGIIILFTLLLTAIGIGFIFYNTFDTRDQNSPAQTPVAPDKTAVYTTNAEQANPVASTRLADNNQVTELKQQIVELNSLVSSLQEKVDSLSQAQAEGSATNTASINKEDVVLKSDLNQRLSEHRLEISKQVDQHVNKVLNRLSAESDSSKSETSRQEVATVSDVTTVSVATVKEPTVAVPSAPVAPSVPQVKQTRDTQWLMKQPRKNYILQLASMADEADLRAMIKKKNLKDVKVVGQLKNKVLSYILVTGSLNSKAEAQKLANEVSRSTSIKPWIRQVEDISRRIK